MSCDTSEISGKVIDFMTLPAERMNVKKFYKELSLFLKVVTKICLQLNTEWLV